MPAWSTRHVDGLVPDLSGRVAVVTGANGGLGLVTARVLGAHGAHVVLAARDVSRADAARDAILAAHPDVRVVVHAVRLDDGNVDDVLRGYDVVVDGTDNFPTRYLVNDACVRLGLPEVWGSVLRFDAQTTVFWGRPPVGVPAVQLRDLFPAPPPPDSVPSCAEAGVLGALCGQVGSVMATEAVKLITGLGEPLLGRVLVVDALHGRWSEVPVVGARPDTDDRTVQRSAGTAPSSPRPVDGDVPTVTAAELVARLDADPTTVLVDVREAAELAVVSVPGATHVPLARVLDGSAVPDLPRDRPVLVICQVGARSALAARTMRAAGVDAANVEGGVLAWLAARA